MDKFNCEKKSENTCSTPPCRLSGNLPEGVPCRTRVCVRHLHQGFFKECQTHGENLGGIEH